MARTAASMSRNIRRCYESATEEQYIAGRSWYADAQAVGASLFGDVELGAAVLAALSPLTPWARNVQLAAMVADGVAPSELPTLGTARKAVARLLAGEPALSVLRGPKVRRFFLAIVTAGQTSECCVDRHARDIAYGVKFTGTGSKRFESSSITAREYREIAAAYVRVAKRLGVSVAVLQAITWSAHRGTAA